MLKDIEIDILIRKNERLKDEVAVLRADVERYRKVVGKLAVAEDRTVTGLLNGKETKFIDKEVAEIFKRFAVSEARKEFAERLKKRAASRTYCTIFESDVDDLLAEMENGGAE